MKAKYIPAILLFSLVASSIETDVSVPGFPAMATYFATTEASIQATLSVNLLGFCLSALFFGPLADSFGRRRLMIGGFFLFGLCSIGCAITNSLSHLLAYRFLQGLGASSIWVIAYAIIGDIFDGKQAAKYISRINAVATAAMALAPAAGAILCKVWGWRSTYTSVAVLSLLSLFILSMWLPETIKEKREFKLKCILKDYRTLLSSYDYMLHALVPSIMSAAYMSYIASAPFLYIDHLQMSFDEYAIHQSFVIASFSIASFKVDWILEKFGELKSQQLGFIICVLSVILMTSCSYLFPTSATLLTIAMMLDGIGVAITFAVLVAKTLEFFPHVKGTASSLMMGIRVAFCSVGVWIGAQFYTGVMFDSVIVIAVLSSLGILANSLTFKYSKVSEVLEG